MPEILLALKDSSKRFTDLKTIAQNERTLSLQLKKLQTKGIIEKMALKQQSDIIVVYKLTKLGRELAEKIST